MASWPRTIKPFSVTDFEVPGPLAARGQSGKVTTRATTQRGRRWTEKYLIDVGSENGREFLAQVRNWYRAGTTVEIVHMDYQTTLGEGGGTPLVKGSAQTGATLDVDGCPASETGWLLAGDIFTIAGINCVYEATADVDSDADGNATIPITPPIFASGSPGDNAALTITGVTVKAKIIDPPDFPETGPNDYGVLTITFTEALG